MKMPLHKRISRQLRSRLRSKVLSAYGIGVVAETRNGALVVDPGDFNVSRQLLTNGEYDWKDVEDLSVLVNSNSRIVVVGAHIGALAIPVALRSGSRAVLAYEASPRNFKLLKMNLALNGLGYVQALNVAVGDHRGSIRYTESPINTGHSRVSRESGELELPLTTLDASIPSDWDSIDLMIMDIEGSEVNAMRGAPATLERTRYLYVEFSAEHLAEQGSTVAEFADLIGRHFSSAQLFDGSGQRLDRENFGKYLQDVAARRKRILNLLLRRD